MPNITTNHAITYTTTTTKNNNNIKGDELLLNFGAKFQRQFVISHVKLLNCHGNLPYASVSRWPRSFKMS